MAVTWEDRVPTYPGRMKITYPDGRSEYVTLERADEPTVSGTPVNAENLNSMVSDIKTAKETAEEAKEVADGKASFGGGAYFNGVNLGAADATAYIYSEGGDVNFRYADASGTTCYESLRTIKNGMHTMTLSGPTLTID